MSVKLPGVARSIESSIESDKTLEGFTKAVVHNSFPEIRSIAENDKKLSDYLSADDRYTLDLLSKYLSQIDIKRDGFGFFKAESEIDEPVPVPVFNDPEKDHSINIEVPEFLFSHTGGTVDYISGLFQDPEYDAVCYFLDFQANFSEVLGNMDLPEAFITDLNVVYGGMFIPYDKINNHEKAGNKFVYFITYEINRKGLDPAFGHMFFYAVPATLDLDKSLTTLLQKENTMPYKTQPEDPAKLMKGSEVLRAYYEYPLSDDSGSIHHLESIYVPLGIHKLSVLEDCRIFCNLADERNTYLRD